jgi:hypothetical protein
MTESILLIAENTRLGIGGVFARSLIVPSIQYFFDGTGTANLLRFANKEIAAIDNGGGVYVLDPIGELFSCLSYHHYAISVLPSSNLIILSNRQVMETNLEDIWIWPIEIDDWLSFEDKNINFNEAAAISLWNRARINPAKQSSKIEYRQASIS